MTEKKGTKMEVARARRAPLHMADVQRIPVEEEDVFFLEDDEDETP
jgi:hypothetical protein